MLALALMLSLAAPTAAGTSTAPARPRVYVAPFVGSMADAETVRLVEDRVLVAARNFTKTHEIVGAADIKTLLTAEAVNQAMGCDSTSCADEIADALSAEQLLSGQLGQIGDTWQLTLTRTERSTLRILGRAVRESRGATPEGLLTQIEEQVDEVMGKRIGLGPFGITGATTAVVGALAAAAGAGLYALSWSQYFVARDELALAAPDVAKAERARDDGLLALNLAYAVGGAGLILAATGAALFAVDGALE